MNFPRDETRRRLRAANRHHDEAMPVVADGLAEAFDPDGPATDADRRSLLGLPDRRGFLRIGGLSIAASTVMAACVQQTKKVENIEQTGTLVATTTTSSTTPKGTPDLDATYLLTAVSIEDLAIDLYTMALDNKWLTDSAIVEVANTFRGQHQQHAELLAGQAAQMGQSPERVPNKALVELVVTPAVDKLKGLSGAEQQKAAVKLALDVEDVAAQTYAKSGGLLSTASIRASMMSIGAIEARHYSVLATVLELPPVPFALEPTGKAAADKAVLAPKGTVNPLPARVTTTARPSTTATAARR